MILLRFEEYQRYQNCPLICYRSSSTVRRAVTYTVCCRLRTYRKISVIYCHALSLSVGRQARNYLHGKWPGTSRHIIAVTE
jgi:hypothetical protein